ncbi:peptidoglycan-binding protein [Microbacterium sp. NPDC058269]|uniref:peptidoglycan-binding protein n=1 Tax=Microbacterium sp. NPDC058269 TaxID=3346414 RepID=UPI0036DF160C
MSRKWLIAAGAVVVAGVVLAAVAAQGFGFSDNQATEAAKKPDLAEVMKQTLVATTEKFGTLSYASESTLRGTAGTVTWLPELGTTIERGGVLLKVDQVPKVLIYGGVPAYRTLNEGTEGDDVRQLEENLAALGYTGFDVDREYTAATEDAVEQWQKDLGTEKTGVITPDFVHYAAGPVQVTGRTSELGDPANGDLITVSSRERTAVVDLDTTEASFAVVGAPVTVTLPDGTSVPGKVASAESAVTDDAGAGPGEPQKKTSLSVTVKPDDPAAITAAGASTVKVAFTSDRREDVLTVPVNALLALGEGGYAVEMAGTKSQKGKLVGVETGLFANGFVEVSGDGITEGMEVVVPAS